MGRRSVKVYLGYTATSKKLNVETVFCAIAGFKTISSRSDVSTGHRDGERISMEDGLLLICITDVKLHKLRSVS